MTEKYIQTNIYIKKGVSFVFLFFEFFEQGVERNPKKKSKRSQCRRFLGGLHYSFSAEVLETPPRRAPSAPGPRGPCPRCVEAILYIHHFRLRGRYSEWGPPWRPGRGGEGSDFLPTKGGLIRRRS